MLKKRIATAVVLAPLALAGVFLLPLQGFAIFLAVILLLAAYEWGPLSGLLTTLSRYSFCAIVLVAVACLMVFPIGDLYQAILASSLALWFVAIYWIMRFPQPGAWSLPIMRAIIGLVFLVATWIALVGLKSSERGDAWILLLFLIVWGADTGAYFAGKRWGKTKLAPNVSPGKTREGMLGGLAIVALVCAVFAQWNELSFSSMVYLMILGVVTAAMSVMGDLFESLLKRNAGLKDSGTLLPGHGGILDRIDSLLAAAPFFYLGLLFFQ
ncbi:phosphatidate cytidylyltransferase [Neptunomonas phycophila]|uniref:Phosphatidate cytidylyltransferase n=1 Tax=Neptunomonas phycophila TaxID=1572645 RepID=A0ABT9EX01_9GAMM|nr:phosphatidate cytidylyltransferase [Neptunomonas phycophila]MDP2523564.1 phosphatidate cytidylyltransferase [Neptunomonas phycophila]